MNILLTNDDGVFAPGIAAVARLLSKDYNVTVVAPAEEQSGKSRAITLYRSLAVREVTIPDVSAKVYSVDGTPADCVRVGLLYLLDENVDLIVSGINRGINVANDVPYSGTVSAAVEALHFDKPSIALSALLKGNQVAYDTTCAEFAKILKRLPEVFLEHAFALNINTPLCMPAEVKGWKIMPSTMHISDQYEWVGSIGDEQHIRICNRYPKDALPFSDLAYLRDNYVTISPLTDGCKSLEKVSLIEDWLNE